MQSRLLATCFSSLALLSVTTLSGATSLLVNVAGDSNAPYGTFAANAGDLRGCLSHIDNAAGGDYDITFNLSSPTITLSVLLPLINAVNNGVVTVDGANTLGTGGHIVIDGASNTVPGFMAIKNNITLKNMTIQNTRTRGGTGAGGGMGAGAAVYIYKQASVSLENVDMTSCQAVGGTGGLFVNNTQSKGGGGMGGNGGNGDVSATAGGGGLGGVGGGAGGYGGGGGGGIIGSASDVSFSGSGGSNTTGYAGGVFATGTQAGSSSGTVRAGGINGGGGGGSSGTPGGAGGGGGILGSNASGLNGGNGGLGGGGGGANISYGGTAGNGGDFGGGGARGAGALTKGNGGFGGGGGSGGYYISGQGGAGGFGGGGGGGVTSQAGGIGGGTGTSAGSGGGAGLGGAIFLMADGGSFGSLSMAGNITTSGNTVTAGAGGSAPATAGAAVGSDMFIMTGTTLNFNPGIGETITLAGTIVDDSSTGLPSGNGYTPGVGAGAAISKLGSGTLVLSGANRYAGTTTILGGILRLNGSITSPVSIGASGTLKGTGTVTGAVTASGTISPGNSIGTLTVNSVTFNSSSTFAVEIDPTTASKLVVTGGSGATVLAGATLSITEDAGSYTPGTQYTILETQAGTITGGTLFNIISSNPSSQFSLSVDPTNHFLYLTLSSGGGGGGGGGTTSAPTQINTTQLTGNDLKLANYLNQLSGYAPLQEILRILRQLSPESLEAALNAIDPVRNSFATFAMQNTSFSFSDLVSSHQNDQRFAGHFTPEEKKEVALLASLEIHQPPAKTKSTPYTFWLSGFGAFAHQKSQEQSPAFDIDSGGTLIGVDVGANGWATVGGTLGYARIHIDQANSFGNQNINNYVGSAYTTLTVSDFFFDVALWGGYYNGKSERNIVFPGFSGTAHGKPHGWQLTPHVMFGYDYEVARNVTIEPFAQFDWAINFLHSFNETGAAPLNMHQTSQTSSLLRSELGAACIQTHRFDGGGIFIAREQLSYVNKKTFNTGNVQAQIVGAPGGFFTVETLTGLQNLVAPGVELFYQTASRFFVSGTYEGEFGSGYTANGFLIKLGKTF
jgi:uncharacterized protein with beta-barrel porin domain